MRLAVLAVLLVFGFTDFDLGHAHSGRTDKYGGHRNRKTGGYHYHSGPKSRSLPSTKRTTPPRVATTPNRLLEMRSPPMSL